MSMSMSSRSDVNRNVCNATLEGKDTGAFVVARCQKILAFYEEESQKSDHEMARWLVEQLTREEQEVAAQCSYAYWFLSQRASKATAATTKTITESVRLATAMREAIRHTDCADNAKDVLKLFRATLEFHARHKTTIYRTCMSRKTTTTTSETETNDTCGAGTAVSTIANVSNNENEQQLSKERRERIHDEMNNYQTNVVRGHDREDRAIFFAFPRKKAGTSDSEEAFVDSLTYTMERAVAASEFQSIGRQDQIVCVLDTKGGSCPPFKTIQAALGILQHFYPGRLKTCVILNAPYLVTALFKMTKPFMHPITVSKFLLTKAKRNNSNKEEDSVLSRLIDESQAMPEMMPGRGKLTSNVNVDRFLYSVPFYRLYDTSSSSSSSSSSSYRAAKETETDPSIDPPIIKSRQKRLDKQETNSTLSTVDFISVSTSSLSSESSDERIIAKKKGIGFVRKGITRFRKKSAVAASSGRSNANANADATSSGGTDAGKQTRRRCSKKGSAVGGRSNGGTEAGKQKRRVFGKKGLGIAGGRSNANSNANDGTSSGGTDSGKQKRITRNHQPGVSVRSLAAGRLAIRGDPEPGVVDFKINPGIVAAIG